MVTREMIEKARTLDKQGWATLMREFKLSQNEAKQLAGFLKLEKIPDASGKEELKKPKIMGITPKRHHDFEKDILPRLIEVGDRASEKNVEEKNQSIEMPAGPFALVLMSDVHGGAKSDYRAIKRDIELIQATDNMYAILAGDLTDNFIIGKLSSLQKHQPTLYDDESRFLEWFLNKLKGSLVAFVSGNHDNWTKKMVAYDHLRSMLDDTLTLFDNNEVRFKLLHADKEEQWLVRHKYRHSSIFNPTHGAEVFWERNSLPFDVAVGGHTHIGTLHREFIKHDKKRHAILLGTYKVRDEYQKEGGWGNTHSDTTGSGAFVYDGKGNKYWCDTVEKAAYLLGLFMG